VEIMGALTGGALGGLEQGGIDGGCFGTEHPTLPPGEGGELLDQELFECTLGLEVTDQGIPEGFEVVEALDLGGDDVPGEDAVGDGIAGDDLLALGSAGTGGGLSVATVSGELFGGDGHGGTPEVRGEGCGGGRGGVKGR
jgi:hypothetical protein